MKPKILYVSDCQKDDLHGKIIYIYEPETPYITAYFYQNPYNLLENKIKRNCLGENNIKESEKIKLKDLKKIAEVSVSDNRYLEHISVEPSYQGKGIGTTLMRFAIQHLQLRHIACLQEQKAAQYCLTIEGERLIASCLNKGIVKPSMCVLQDWTDEGPGLVSPLIAKTLQNLANQSSQPTRPKIEKHHRTHTWPGSSKNSTCMGSFNPHLTPQSADITLQKPLSQQEALNKLFAPDLSKLKRQKTI